MQKEASKYQVSSRFRSVVNAILNEVPEHNTGVIALALGTFLINAKDDSKKPAILIASKGSGLGHIVLNAEPGLTIDRTLTIEVKDLMTGAVHQMKIQGKDQNGKAISYDKRISADFLGRAIEDFVLNN